MILNLTQHTATTEQRDAGVVDLSESDAAYVRRFLTADSLDELSEDAEDGGTPDERAAIIADRALEIFEDADAPPADRAAMIGGAPWLMAPLHAALMKRGITPLYAFSRRESVEEIQPDGSVRKTNVFRHVGFVRAG